MAAEYRTFTVTVPAGTVQASPVTVALTMPARVVRSVRIRFPPGPNGTTGIRLGAAGVQLVPWNTGAWLVGNDEVIDWPLEGQIDSGAWQAFGYNTGVNAHTVYVTFGLDMVPGAGGVGQLGTPLVITPG